MIGCTKLLCGQATVSEIIRQEQQTAGHTPAHLLQFSSESRPIVVWNMTYRCNLRCLHCYLSASSERDQAGELSTDEGKILIDELGHLEVPVLLFSGGEPFLREDLLELVAYTKAKGIRPVISSNGTLISKDLAARVREAGAEYVGVSLDGAREVHDRFRGLAGAFDQALTGIRNCLEAGVKAGVRFTVNKANKNDLKEVLRIVEELRIPRFCMYHLVYAGRGRKIKDEDLSPQESREIMDLLIAVALRWEKEGRATEILTTDNHADGPYIKSYLEKHDPARASAAEELLKRAGGCSAGEKVANISPRGDVHPCQFWGYVTLGNVRKQPFGEIWGKNAEGLLMQLRKKEELLSGRRCPKCRFREFCRGCRIRAEAVYGDPWADDPACYLTDAEIGL